MLHQTTPLTSSTRLNSGINRRKQTLLFLCATRCIEATLRTERRVSMFCFVFLVQKKKLSLTNLLQNIQALKKIYYHVTAALLPFTWKSNISLLRCDVAIIVSVIKNVNLLERSGSTEIAVRMALSPKSSRSNISWIVLFVCFSPKLSEQLLSLSSLRRLSCAARRVLHVAVLKCFRPQRIVVCFNWSATLSGLCLPCVNCHSSQGASASFNNSNQTMGGIN